MRHTHIRKKRNECENDDWEDKTYLTGTMWFDNILPSLKEIILESIKFSFSLLCERIYTPSNL